MNVVFWLYIYIISIYNNEIYISMKLSTMAVVYQNAGLFTFAIFALRDSGVKPLG